MSVPAIWWSRSGKGTDGVWFRRTLRSFPFDCGRFFSLPSLHSMPSLFTVLPRFWVCKISFWNFFDFIASLSLLLSPCPHCLSLFHREVRVSLKFQSGNMAFVFFPFLVFFFKAGLCFYKILSTDALCGILKEKLYTCHYFKIPFFPNVAAPP